MQHLLLSYRSAPLNVVDRLSDPPFSCSCHFACASAAANAEKALADDKLRPVRDNEKALAVVAAVVRLSAVP